ncbi:hypothetical protein [Shewanella sp. ALD9]|uniref:hypothetical protein n=1 Tax=Shewanella sp. ALD9 TaxID=2058330 RepID=UPI000C331D7A|nr:hypothetical protein [Shewanella sp. ALD9]PKH31963.1 hypothetical protein CXF88_08650 [Shewanella sp. ALD9]
MEKLAILKISLKELVQIITTKGAPYVSFCHLSDEVVLVSYYNNELRAYASLEMPDFASDLLLKWTEILWAGNVPNSTYTYLDIWRPEYNNLDVKDIPLLRELGFLEIH